MKKIVFLFLLSFFCAQNISAQEAPEITAAQCEAQSGECNTFSESCESNQEKIGICSGIINDTACCKFKDNGPVDLSYRGIDLDDYQSKGLAVPVVGTRNCTAPKSSGGMGGTCRRSEIDAVNPLTDADFCNDSGNDEEDFVGLCQVESSIGTESARTDCCVPKGTAIKDAPASSYATIIMSENTCENSFNASGSGYGGKCEDIDSNSWDPTGGWIDGKEPTCDTPGEVVVGLCQGSFLGIGTDSFNGCCVPKDGDYCKKLKDDNGGSDVCSGGIGGTATSLEYGDYTLLEQIPGSSNTSGKLQPYLESIYKAGFVLIVLGAIFMIGFGGFIYMSSAGNTYMIKKGKGLITDAIVGLVVALIIWLILSIINPDLVNLKIDPLPGVSFDPAGEGEIIAGENSIEEGGGGSGYFAAKTYSGSALFTDAQARNYLSGKQIQVNKKDCESASQTNCTSLGEFPQVMANIAAAIKSGCNCEVVITGGTEAGHSTHGKGRAAMDIRKNADLDKFFSKFTKVGQSGGKPIYQYASVRVWFEDSEHYHIWEPAK